MIGHWENDGVKMIGVADTDGLNVGANVDRTHVERMDELATES